jgi:membrane-associated HD superfamily phosphohydrolase
MLANEQFPEGFSKVVRAKFVSVTGISDNRVTLVAKKRNLNQADSALEVEISIAQGIIPIISDLKYTTNWIRWAKRRQKPAQIVQEFVNNQQEAFTEQINNDASAPQNITLDSKLTVLIVTLI